ncbi:MAG: hypothetical protein HY586_00570 [Candidatus Omnitrophica bacterium]|nr:hypothetical protein [Candidatus Omnitrophota bacterium]
MKNQIKSDKLQQALDLLNEAAVEKRDALRGLFNHKYTNARHLFFHTVRQGQKAVRKNRIRFIRTVKLGARDVAGKAKEWDQKVHEHPWIYMGVVAMSSMVLGAMMHHRTGNRHNRNGHGPAQNDAEINKEHSQPHE